MSGIRIVYDGTHSTHARFAEAVANANTILGSWQLRKIIEDRKKKFYNTNRTCEDIAQAIYDCNATITIETFTEPARPDGMITTGYAQPGSPDIIFYNTEVFGNRVKSQTNTLVHEAVHVVDMFHDRISGSDFTHNGNDPYKPRDNLDSAPYWIGDRGEDLVDALDDHVGSMKTTEGFDSLDFQLVEKYLTEEIWAAKHGFVCGTAD